MNQKQEIRAKALEIAVRMIAALPKEWVNQYLNEARSPTAEQVIIGLSRAFEVHIKG